MAQCTSVEGAIQPGPGPSCSSATAAAASECNSLEALRDAWAHEPPSTQPSDSGEAEGLMADYLAIEQSSTVFGNSAHVPRSPAGSWAGLSAQLAVLRSMGSSNSLGHLQPGTPQSLLELLASIETESPLGPAAASCSWPCTTRAAELTCTEAAARVPMHHPEPGSQLQQQSKPTGNAAAASSPLRPRRFGKDACQSDGCAADLSPLSYHMRRNHICKDHYRALSFEVQGVPTRFCQRCGMGHRLVAFDNAQRCCRRSLERGRQRRRERDRPSPSMPSSRTGAASSEPAELRAQLSAGMQLGTERLIGPNAAGTSSQLRHVQHVPHVQQQPQQQLLAPLAPSLPRQHHLPSFPLPLLQQQPQQPWQQDQPHQHQLWQQQQQNQAEWPSCQEEPWPPPTALALPAVLHQAPAPAPPAQRPLLPAQLCPAAQPAELQQEWVLLPRSVVECHAPQLLGSPPASPAAARAGGKLGGPQPSYFFAGGTILSSPSFA